MVFISSRLTNECALWFQEFALSQTRDRNPRPFRTHSNAADEFAKTSMAFGTSTGRTWPRGNCCCRNVEYLVNIFDILDLWQCVNLASKRHANQRPAAKGNWNTHSSSPKHTQFVCSDMRTFDVRTVVGNLFGSLTLVLGSCRVEFGNNFFSA